MKKINEYIKPLVKGGICVAFSGGVDSSLILQVACEEARKEKQEVYAVTFETKLHPKADLEIARKIAGEVGAIHHVVYVNELENDKILQNPEDRCYHCKKYLFEELIKYAETVGLSYILDGTNYDDLSQYRPGIRALQELGILSPLVELEITKKEVRQLAEERGISVSNRPSTPCLATRLPYGTTIDFEVLSMVEEGEKFLKGKGFLVNRIRVHGDIARIEIHKEQFQEMLDIYNEVVLALSQIGFIYVTLDLEGFRSGSMDVHLQNKDRK